MKGQEHPEDQQEYQEQGEDAGAPPREHVYSSVTNIAGYSDILRFLRAFLLLGLCEIALGGVLLCVSYLMKEDLKRLVASISVFDLVISMGLSTSLSFVYMVTLFHILRLWRQHQQALTPARPRPSTSTRITLRPRPPLP